MKNVFRKLFLSLAGLLLAAATQAATTDYFIITVKTDNPGSSASNQFTIPTAGSGYNYDVDLQGLDTWEYTGITGNTTCVYATPGTYTVRIRNTFPQIYFNGDGDRQKLLTIEQWGTGAWITMFNAFAGCSNLTLAASDAPNLSNVTYMGYMFWNASSLNQSMTGWDTSHVINMQGMFSNASAFNQDISGWNTASVENMSSMFSGAAAFNQPIGAWNTGAVKYMTSMFSGASAFNQNISGWNTANVTSMQRMFQNAAAFNQNISGWNTAKVTDMSTMFYGASAFNQPIGAWNTGAVTRFDSMFRNATAFNQLIGTWNTVNATNMNTMFSGATAFNQPIGGWNTGAVTRFDSMFYNASAFNQPIGTWDTANVTNMSSMFFGAAAFNQNLAAWNTSKVTNMSSMFSNAVAFNQDIAAWDTSKVLYMLTMFNGAVAFNQNLGSWNVGALTSASGMFSGITLTSANYDALLTGWADQSVQPNVVFDGGHSRFNSVAAEMHRAILTSGSHWTITDGGRYGTPTVTPTSTVSPSATITPTVMPTMTLTPTPRNAFSDVDLTGKLFLAYPNPGREQVKFLVDPDRAVQVKIQMTNLNGEPVGVVTDSLPAGRGVVVWDCSSVAPGLYIARISLDGKEVGKTKVAVVR